MEFEAGKADAGKACHSGLLRSLGGDRKTRHLTWGPTVRADGMFDSFGHKIIGREGPGYRVPPIFPGMGFLPLIYANEGGWQPAERRKFDEVVWPEENSRASGSISD